MSQRIAGVTPVVATGVSDEGASPEGCRRLSKDYEVLPETTEAFIYVAMIHLMIKGTARNKLSKLCLSLSQMRSH
ncbi:hypothetical protein [Nostoc sp.]|uniref:hypothetical protein n=1 Tax=Nostoc sp. TaxID=1180 RepID=UPI002FF6ABE4